MTTDNQSNGRSIAGLALAVTMPERAACARGLTARNVIVHIVRVIPRDDAVVDPRVARQDDFGKGGDDVRHRPGALRGAARSTSWNPQRSAA